MLLQHIWVSYLQFRPQLQTYQELIEKVKLTPRIWNPAVKLNDLLKYLSWILDLSINIIGLKHTKNPHTDTFQCTHSKTVFSSILQISKSVHPILSGYKQRIFSNQYFGI